VSLQPAALPRRDAALGADSDSDLDRGRTVSLLAALGRMQLSLDLIERRVANVEAMLSSFADEAEEPVEASMGLEPGDS
jgi:hypothetical protein